MSTKRKASVDKSTLPKKTKHWFAEGLDELSAIFNLKSYASLAFEQQKKKRDWVGAYPDPNSPEPTYTVRGKPEPVYSDRKTPLRRHFYSDSISSLGSNEDEDVLQGKPYRLEPYTKPPSFTPVDFRDRFSLLSSPTSDAARNGSYDRDDKEDKEDSSAHVPSYANHDSRLKYALDATIGTLKSERETSWGSRRESTLSYADEVAENRRLRAINHVEKQQRPPGHQSVQDEHDRIEKELATRKKKDQFVPFSSDDEQRIASALAPGYPDGILAQGFNLEIKKRDIQTLCPGEWLNDEVINFYINLIIARSKESTTLPKVHVFSTFFYKVLTDSGYEKVRRWSKKAKVDIFELDYVLIPIHCSGNHWTSAVIDMKRKRISYYDSLLGNNPKCFLMLREYLDKESQDKRSKPFNFEGWENDCPKDIPRQRNGYDCGVFTCTFIEFKSRGSETFDFSQEEMPYLRKKLVLDIINKSL
ncbi:SUMO1 sentrin specific peptidase 1 [Linnemannia exigua]|uniref:SUMO1 sentrin specific peptidase 1 n=1 Tax=Linnemannia exigua TaxID=604196 RepID=A0AAD4H647_9FUNG|nr:SUMO1 sentrin specific peptidase 1 [Linnemannia exigua]